MNVDSAGPFHSVFSSQLALVRSSVEEYKYHHIHLKPMACFPPTICWSERLELVFHLQQEALGWGHGNQVENKHAEIGFGGSSKSASVLADVTRVLF